MTHDPVMLAAKIGKRIATGEAVSYTTLEDRAKELEVPDAIFEQAMTIVHRSKVIERKVKGEDIFYSVKVVKVKEPGSHLTWIRHNYPQMDSSNDGSGIEADFSHLFLTPDELLEYKAKLRGVAFIPRTRYGSNTRG